MQKYFALLLIIGLASAAAHAQQGTNHGNDPVRKEYQQTLFQLSGRADVIIR